RRIVAGRRRDVVLDDEERPARLGRPERLGEVAIGHRLELAGGDVTGQRGDHVVLRGLDVRLVERVDVQERAAVRGRQLPGDHLRADVVQVGQRAALDVVAGALDGGDGRIVAAVQPEV